jgi:release factor glutamine methyltransferase
VPRPTVATLIAEATARLPGENAALDAELLFRGLASWSRSDLLARAATTPAPETIAAFEGAVARRGLNEPVQYILGKAAFWRDEFMVTPAVLIPRPDTETLVEAVAARLAHVEAARFLDVGTGSGCIALSLLRELPRARALAVDVSIEALNVARQNAKALGCDDRIEFAVSNWLSAVPGAPLLDAIVSNPPYVDRGDEASLPAEVRDFEPALALFAEAEDDLSSYRAILGQIGGRLRPGGILALEVGHGQAGRVADLVVAGGFTSIETVDDLASIPRVVIARQP